LHARINSAILNAGNRKTKKGWITMSSLLTYKNYNGTVEYSKEDKCLFGKVVGIKSLLSYEGNSIQELEKDFQTVIDEYLADCKERNVQAEQPYKGTFNVRISPELHRTIAVYAMEHGETLNAAVEEAICKMVAD
jgi:predicted HicB family RNase H-like nuclease